MAVRPRCAAARPSPRLFRSTVPAITVASIKHEKPDWLPIVAAGALLSTFGLSMEPAQNAASVVRHHPPKQRAPDLGVCTHMTHMTGTACVVARMESHLIIT